MADLTAFSCGNFDTATWINDSFRERPEEEALESYLASLAMKLHIISQDYTDQLETGPSAYYSLQLMYQLPDQKYILTYFNSSSTCSIVWNNFY